MAMIFRISLLFLVFLSGCDWNGSPSKNADLLDLSLSAGVLNPAFLTTTFDYTATVNQGTDSITVTAVTDHGGATITVNDTAVSSGDPSVAIPLSAGNNTITVVVTAKKQSSQQTYTIVVTRQVSNYSVGGTVSGLTGTVTLQNNGADDLAVVANGVFTFATDIANGGDYDVTVSGQPAGEVCTVSDGNGVIAAADVTNISVTCVVPTFSVGGTVSGLTGTVTLQNNGADDLAVAANGIFTFAIDIADGGDYDVTVSGQPAGQSCSVTNGGGTIAGADVTNISVTCVVPTFSVGGTVSGLTGTVTLQNNGADDLAVAGNGSFTFATAIVNGGAYDVTVSGQPAGQTCSVGNGNGTIAGANVTNVTVTCVDDPVATYSVGGTASGLTGTVTLQNNAADDLEVAGNGSFTFLTEIDDGSTYSVTVGAQPAGQICSVSSGGGTINGANVTNVSVSCVDSGGGGTSDWKWANPLPQGNAIADMVWNGSQFVAVATYGTILTSPDGTAWTTQVSGTNSDLRGAAWDGSQFVVVGGAGTILTSPDGVTWTAQVSGTANNLQDIAWNGSQFVAVGSGTSGQVLTSPDGIAWTTRAVVSAYLNLASVAWNGSVFAAVDSLAAVYTSANGVTWTRVYVGNRTPYSIASDGNQFVVVGSSVIYTSPDGTAWSVAEEGGNLGQILGISWDGNQFLAAGSSRVFTSPDAGTWTQQNIDTRSKALRTIIGNGSLFVAAGDAGIILNSPDAVAWTLQSSGEFDHLSGIVWSGSQFVAVGQERILTSPDAVSWTPHDQGTPPPWTNSASLFAIASNDNLFVAVGALGAVITSPDGVTWTPGTSDSTEYLLSIAWDGSQFVAVGWAGTVLTSPDGLSWTAQDAGTTATARFQDIVWNGGQFAAVGFDIGNGDTLVMTSPDAVTWTNQAIAAPVWTVLNGVTWDGSQFVITGSGRIFTSPDGITWARQADGVPETENYQDIIWTGSQFVVTTNKTIVLTSPDAVTWTSQNAVSGNFVGIAWDGSQIVVVGFYGTILTNGSL